MRWQALQLSYEDNVAVMLTEGKARETIEVKAPDQLPDYKVVLRDDIPFCHKAAVRNIAKGELVIKYGRAIGRATEEIVAGELVSVHNLEGLRGRGDLEK